jgi:hypothetical protein
MYYEEKVINNKMHYRNDPDAEFKEYTIEELTYRYENKKREANLYFLRLQQVSEVLSPGYTFSFIIKK